MTVTLLEKLKSILQREVCDKIELRESDDDNEGYRVVNPSCFIGWIPPDNQMMQFGESLQKQKSIPCLVVGMEKAVDVGEHEEVDIKLNFAVYSPGEVDQSGVLNVNFEGYVSLLNFIDKTKAFLIKDSFNLDCMIINSEIESGVFEEQAYPIWLGYMKFKVRRNAYPKIDKQKYL
ncbi:MAG: hypothetical protein RR444_09750 [Oscillospiraceae bacterium]